MHRSGTLQWYTIVIHNTGQEGMGIAGSDMADVVDATVPQALSLAQQKLSAGLYRPRKKDPTCCFTICQHMVSHMQDICQWAH